MRKLYLFLLLGSPLLQGANVILNGGFESGSANWNRQILSTSANSIAATTGGCATQWQFSASFNDCVLLPSAVGTLAAYSSFDGFGFRASQPALYAAVTYDLFQEVTVPSGVITAASLTWFDTLRVTFLSPNQPRTFSVSMVEVGTGTETTFFTRSLSDVNESAAFTQRNVDLTALLQPRAGQNIQIHFKLLIPEFLTGPAGFGLDDVALNITSTAVPEPATGLAALFALAVLAGRKQKAPGA